MVASAGTSLASATFLQADTNASRSSWFNASFAASTSAGAASAGGSSPSKFISLTTVSPASYLLRILSVTSWMPSEGSNRKAAHSAPYGISDGASKGTRLRRVSTPQRMEAASRNLEGKGSPSRWNEDPCETILAARLGQLRIVLSLRDDAFSSRFGFGHLSLISELNRLEIRRAGP